MKKALLSLFVAIMAFGLATEPVFARDGHRGYYGHHSRHGDSNYDHGRGSGSRNALALVAGVVTIGVIANALTSDRQAERVVVYEAPSERQCRSNFIGHTYDGRPVFQKVCLNPYTGQWYYAQ